MWVAISASSPAKRRRRQNLSIATRKPQRLTLPATGELASSLGPRRVVRPKSSSSGCSVIRVAPVPVRRGGEITSSPQIISNREPHVAILPELFVFPGSKQSRLTHPPVGPELSASLHLFSSSVRPRPTLPCRCAE
ncbi:hypothetical protein GQ607_002452 [Colletotrichum asianum]|uniref:Uncharacterized protein n=1 Tax=Colletotrichum asianum TaxID=702518 RepID=A0A8H3WSW2_9PEZI|nr:hypothetical protein GQ607_002452 [Colletotrichum asianum]